MVKKSEPLAVIVISNNMALVITEVNDTEETVSSYFGGDKYAVKSKLRFDDNGRAYFKRGGAKYYLDEAIRTDVGGRLI